LIFLWSNNIKFLITLITRIGITIIGLLINKLIAVNLGPNGIVVLGQLKSFMNLMTQFGIAGSNNLIIRLFTKDHFKSQIFRTLILVTVAINLMLIILGIFYIDHLTLFLAGTLDLKNSILYLVYSIPAMSLIALNTAIVNGQARQILFGILLLSYPLIFLLLLSSFSPLTLHRMIISFVLSIIITSFMITIYNRKYFFISLKRTIKIEVLKKIATYGLTLIFPFLVNTLVLIYLRTLMMEKDIVNAGLWQAVWQISDNMASIIYLYIISVLLPKSLKKKHPRETILFLLKHYQLPLLLFVLGGSIFILFSEQLLTLLYDNSFIKAKELIIYQLIGDFFKVLGWAFLLTIASYGLLKLSIIIETINLLTSLILIYYFIETYSTIGASYAYMSKYILYVLTMCIVFYIYTKPTTR